MVEALFPEVESSGDKQWTLAAYGFCSELSIEMRAYKSVSPFAIFSPFHSHLADKYLFRSTFHNFTPVTLRSSLQSLQINWCNFYFLASPFFLTTPDSFSLQQQPAKRWKCPERQTETLHTEPVQQCQAEHNKSSQPASQPEGLVFSHTGKEELGSSVK